MEGGFGVTFGGEMSGIPHTPPKKLEKGTAKPAFVNSGTGGDGDDMEEELR
jgi:hypothetical protein